MACSEPFLYPWMNRLTMGVCDPFPLFQLGRLDEWIVQTRRPYRARLFMPQSGTCCSPEQARRTRLIAAIKCQGVRSTEAEDKTCVT